LISWSHSSPEGGSGAEIGRHGATKPVSGACEREDMKKDDLYKIEVKGVRAEGREAPEQGHEHSRRRDR
jgi:hypothetical protein